MGIVIYCTGRKDEPYNWKNINQCTYAIYEPRIYVKVIVIYCTRKKEKLYDWNNTNQCTYVDHGIVKGSNGRDGY